MSLEGFHARRQFVKLVDHIRGHLVVALIESIVLAHSEIRFDFDKMLGLLNWSKGRLIGILIFNVHI